MISPDKLNILNNRGQSSLQLIVPLLIVLSFLIIFAMFLPFLSTLKTIALAVGFIIFILSFISTEFALYILVLSMLLSPEFIVGTTSGPALERGVTLRLDDFILLIISFSWIAKMSINKELGLFLRTPLNKPIAYYIIICLVSTLLGFLFGRVTLKVGFFFVLKYFEYFIVYFMVVNQLRDKQQVKNFLWAMLVTCSIVSLIGISQIPMGGRVTAPFEGASGEPNTFGGYLVLMISVAIGLLLTSPSVRGRIFFALLILLFIIPLIYTQSRTSYLALIPALLTFIFLSEKRNLIIIFFLIIAIALPFLLPDIAKKRILYTFTQGKGRANVVEFGGVKLDTSTSARITSWKAALKAWVRHPFIGYGVTGYRFVDAQYIRVLVETGFLGLMTFMFMISAMLARVKRIFQDSTDPFASGLSLGFLAGIIGLLFHGIGANTFIIVRIMEPFWFIAAMVLMIPELKEVGEDR
ncbi:MAG: O-antigen ligase family protein [Deltaproteobacteria bacterium]|nr:O-antigen ligase family protein [Deltaproteobacteria bacterium]